jgi:hypothetical protein
MYFEALIFTRNDKLRFFVKHDHLKYYSFTIFDCELMAFVVLIVYYFF